MRFTHREGNFSLGHWVVERRADYRHGLTAEQIHALEALSGWTWAPREDAFQIGLKSLRPFVGREGHARVPASHVEQGFPLGQWVDNLRQQYRRRRLAPERVATLERIRGWSWRVADLPFERGFKVLQRFVRRTDHARVPADHVEGGFSLGAWVRKRRAERHQMPIDKKQRLQSIACWEWSTRSA